MRISYRALSGADSALAGGGLVTTCGPLAVADDPGRATGAFAAESVLVLLLRDEAVDEDGSLPAGTRLVVVGERSMMHHLPSAVDIEIRAVAVAEEGVPADGWDEGFSQAMRRISLALAAGADGVTVPVQYGASIQG